jgi:hypothetical protein
MSRYHFGLRPTLGACVAGTFMARPSGQECPEFAFWKMCTQLPNSNPKLKRHARQPLKAVGTSSAEESLHDLRGNACNHQTHAPLQQG